MSDDQLALVAEISFVGPGRSALERAPVYTIQKPVVCFKCGFTELVIPTPELEKLKDASAARGNAPPE